MKRLERQEDNFEMFDGTDKCKSLEKNGKNCGTEMARDFLDVPSFAAAECLLTEILEQAMGKNK